MQIVILASGRGKRTRHNSKSLIDIGNTCLFDQNKNFKKTSDKILTVDIKKKFLKN